MFKARVASSEPQTVESIVDIHPNGCAGSRVASAQVGRGELTLRSGRDETSRIRRLVRSACQQHSAVLLWNSFASPNVAIWIRKPDLAWVNSFSVIVIKQVAILKACACGESLRLREFPTSSKISNFSYQPGEMEASRLQRRWPWNQGVSLHPIRVGHLRASQTLPGARESRQPHAS